MTFFHSLVSVTSKMKQDNRRKRQVASGEV